MKLTEILGNPNSEAVTVGEKEKEKPLIREAWEQVR